MLYNAISNIPDIAFVAYTISSTDETIGIIVAGISFVIYWYNNLSVNTARLNAQYWKQQQWWWQLDGWQFEQEVANVFRINGYRAKVTKGSGDGGIDIILEKDGMRYIVQCKHYQNPVPPEPIRALWGVKNDFNADGVILVASSGITKSGAEFVRGKSNFKVLNLNDIIRLSQQSTQYQQTPSQPPSQQIYEEETQNSKNYSYGRKLDL